MNERLPLHDVRVIAIEQYGAGPFGSVHLADLGAEVIKIEDPALGGEIGRTIPPYAHDNDSLFFQSLNRNKRSLALDLRVASDRAIFDDLVKASDAVYSNVRGDVPDKLGIRYDHLKHLNPSIVCCTLSAFGLDGPRAAEPGYDYVVQGLAGWMSLTGEPDGPPTKTGLSLVDFSAGFVAAFALVVGLHAARRDGIGMDCDVSLFDTAISMLNYPATWHLTAGYTPERTARSAHPSLVPFQNFPTSDGWIVIACAKEKFWHRLVRALGRPELAMDVRFATYEDRLRNRDDLEKVLDDVLLTRTSSEWIALLAEAEVPCARINDVPQALAEPQTASRGMIVETEHPHWGTVRQIGTPVNAGPRRTEHRRAPTFDEDRVAILRDVLGYTEAEIDAATSRAPDGDQ